MANTKYIYLKLSSPPSVSPSDSPDPKLSPHYFSLTLLDQQYFSSVLTNTAANDHFVFKFDASTETNQSIIITRWASHMPIFTNTIELAELISKTNLRKKINTCSEQFIEVTINVISEQQLPFSDRKPTADIAHYFCFDSFKYTRTAPKPKYDNSDNICPYLCVKTSQKQYFVPEPLEKRSIIIQLPDKIRFSYHCSLDEDPSQSEALQTAQMYKRGAIVMTVEGRKIGSLGFEGRWGFNKMPVKSETLIDTSELALYDFEMSFDKENQYPDCHLKVCYGNKVFDCAPDSNNGKKMRYKKLLHVILKPEEEELYVCLERNHVEIANFRLFTDQMRHIEILKRKMADVNTGKSIGTLKFKLEKAKTLSLPENNKSWRESLKKKMTANYIYEVTQLSYHSPLQLPMKVRLCIGNQQSHVQGVYNLARYQPLASQMHQSQVISVFQVRDEKDFFVFFDEAASQDTVEAMGVVDLNNLSLGVNPLRFPLFRNQKIVGQVHSLVNKIPNINFGKAVYQPDILTKLKRRTRNVSVEVSPVTLTAYFYTYEYDNKKEMYGIVEINKAKKVLILDRQPNSLVMVEGDGSDYLNFVIEESEYVRIKLTFLVADLGFEEEIYGTAIFKCRFQDLLTAATVNFPVAPIKNAFDLAVGSVSVTIKLGDQQPKAKVNPLANQIKQLKTSVEEANKNIRRSLEDNNTTGRNNNSLNIEKSSERGEKGSKKPFKLPTIAKSLKASSVVSKPQSIHELVSQLKNHHNSKQSAFNLEDTMDKINADVEKNRQIFAAQRVPLKKKGENKDKEYKSKSIALDGYRNIDISKNFDLLFPKKKMRKAELELQINQYEEKLKGLKSVLNEIDGDLESVKPDVASARYSERRQSREGLNTDPLTNKKGNEEKLQGYSGMSPEVNGNVAQFQDNEFMIQS